MKQNKYPDWFLAAWENGPRIIMAIGLIATIAIVVLAVDVENRLNRIEDRLEYSPPRSYEPPDLELLKADTLPSGPGIGRRKVYAPVYSHVYFLGGSPFALETTLSIRNVDLANPVYVTSVEYFNTEGQLVKTHVQEPIKLAPLQTLEFLVTHRDTSGGSGANFIVEWTGDVGVNKPLVETVMVGSSGTQSICFSRSGVEVAGLEDRARESVDVD